MQVIHLARNSVSLAALGLLSACYVSDVALIPDGEAVLPLDHGLTLCPDRPDNCVPLSVQGDTYVTAPDADPDETGAARFSPLAQVNGRQIFLLEAHDTGDDTFTYLVARRRSPDAAGVADLDLALVSCDDLSSAQSAAFVQAGGQVNAGWGGECRAPDLQTLTSTLRAVYETRFADEDWWAQGGAD